MRRILTINVALVSAVLISAAPSAAVTITNGSLSVTIRNDNGAIDFVVFGGSNFYDQGTHVSDWAMQQGTNASTFALNTTAGGADIPIGSVTESGGVVTATGSFGDIDVTREYWIVPGLNVLRTRTTVSNGGEASIALRLVDTFDPDQGIDQGFLYETFNDIYSLSGMTVGRSSISTGLAVIMGGLDYSRLSFGCPPTPFDLGIDGGGALNNFFVAGPCDPNGAFEDIGIALGASSTLGFGDTASFTFDQAYGLSIADAEDDFSSANVPEPGTLALIGSGLAAVFARRRRR